MNCRIVLSKDKTKAWLEQPELIKIIKKNFRKIVKNMKEYGTPEMPNIGISRSFEEDIALKNDKQLLY